ncbi:ricin-type beta-trefoil lectin domain protein [Actinoplanes siamensis]|uniref:Ricin B lectin domain-containing protein n=1 Tax=Actinoplanes siamensis TaxID=1223317 RepID=A0A919NBA7_9ACTN|nr:ricin-type beta-trefoil lectin domain protein [Actinoplanes siamensis]GIF07590.1 hypothetical protein Asi03nite_51280 [Actinoplanes siamensis]
MRMMTRLRNSDDEGSLPMAMLVITVVMSLSALLVPITLRQIKATQNYSARNVALDAAQAGMDQMMARVRAAADPDSLSGFLESLPPCTALTGDAGVSSTGGGLPYTVKVEYFDEDGKALDCPTNDVPTTASVTATGVSDGITRTLTATYVFSTSNTNIPGGQIKIDTSTLGNQCLDSGSSKTPPAGATVVMAKCDGSSRQQFGYTPELYLKLINSETSSATSGMCLHSGATHASGNPVVFRPCPTSSPIQTAFQWSLDGSSLFHSTNSSKAVESLCMSVTYPGDSIKKGVTLGSCSATANKTIWRSATGVGAGMAGDRTNQLVNYAQFSRCLDVTNKSTGSTYMIAWFCKQAPNGVVDFNQQWVHPTPVLPAVTATGPIIVNNTNGSSNSVNGNPDNNYCLKSPGSTSATIYVTVVSCKTTAAQAAPELQWTVYHDTGDYGTSYRILDYKGYCLTPTAQGSGVASDFHGDGTSKVKVAVCNTSELQKWNAPPNISQPTPLTNLTEK